MHLKTFSQHFKLCMLYIKSRTLVSLKQFEGQVSLDIPTQQPWVGAERQVALEMASLVMWHSLLLTYTQPFMHLLCGHSIIKSIHTQVSHIAGGFFTRLSHKGSPYYVSRSLNICHQMPFLNMISGHMRRELDWENSQGKIYWTKDRIWPGHEQALLPQLYLFSLFQTWVSLWAPL